MIVDFVISFYVHAMISIEVVVEYAWSLSDFLLVVVTLLIL
jgi:hypothetical protein